MRKNIAWLSTVLRKRQWSTFEVSTRLRRWVAGRHQQSVLCSSISILLLCIHFQRSLCLFEHSIFFYWHIFSRCWSKKRIGISFRLHIIRSLSITAWCLFLRALHLCGCLIRRWGCVAQIFLNNNFVDICWFFTVNYNVLTCQTMQLLHTSVSVLLKMLTSNTPRGQNQLFCL